MAKSHFSRERVTDRQLQRLGQVLWSWSLCDSCQDGRRCTTENCPWQRKTRLKIFFDHYKDLIASYEPDTIAGTSLDTHEDLFEIIERLKRNPHITRAQFTVEAFKDHASQELPVAEDQARAVNLAVKVMTMITCRAQHQSGGLIEHGTFQNPWLSDVTFASFIMDILPPTDHPSLIDDDANGIINFKSALTACNLKKRVGMKFAPTNDLKEHLKLDRTKNVLHIYHHTAFLKENLRLTRDLSLDKTVSEFLEIGALPRQLVLECLDSIQKVLFPLTDSKSKSILISLTSTSAFDPDCLRFESRSIRKPDEQDITYRYFGAHLADLYAELEHPTPRGWLQQWFERKSGARYIMMATLIGVIAAVILGILGVAIGIFQAWIAYQQWQHPISPPTM